MLGAATDYDAAVRALRAQALPAIVEYTETGSASGLKRVSDGPLRIVVDTRTNRIVSKTGPHGVISDEEGDDPVTRRLFNPACYRPTGERAMNWNGRAATAITVAGAGNCKNEDFDLATIYTDSATNELLGADGSETDEGVTVDYGVQYARFNGYVMPATISAHVRGHGWLFWVRERAEVHYSDYVFRQTRRQTGN